MLRGLRAQSSIEYIFIVAFAMMIIIPGAFVFNKYSSTSQEGLRNAQIYKIGNDIIDASEQMYSVGENSWQTIDLTFPPDIISVKIYNGSDGINELVIQYEGKTISDAVFFTEIPISNSSSTSSSIEDCTLGCPLHIISGKNSIRVESLRNSIVVLRVVT